MLSIKFPKGFFTEFFSSKTQILHMAKLQLNYKIIMGKFGLAFFFFFILDLWEKVAMPYSKAVVVVLFWFFK